MADIAKLIYKKNTMYSSGWGFSPETQGSTGQVLTKTATWYDWDDGSNTKIFELPADLTSADAIAVWQAIYDWYSDGKNPIVLWWWYSQRAYYPIRGRSSASVLYLGWDMLSITNTVTKWKIGDMSISIMVSSWTVTSVSGGSGTSWYFLQTDVNYSTPYTPQYAWSPATKKYVDDMVWDIETLLSNI